MVGTNGGALSPGHAARPTPGLLYVLFGPLDTRCESDALGIPAPYWFPSLTPAHAGSGHGAGGTDSQTGKEEGTLDCPDSPAAAGNPSRCPGPPADARSPGRCAQIQPSLPAQCLLTALSAPRQREGAPGRWPGLRDNPALRPLGRERRCAQLRAGRPDARTEPAEGGAGRRGEGPAARGRTGAGQRARAPGPTLPAAVPVPWPGANRQPGARARGVTVGPSEDNGRPLLPLQRYPPVGDFPRRRCRFRLPKHKERSPDARFKEGPGGAAARVHGDNRTPPAPRTPALNLVRPPLPIPTGRPSCAKFRRGGR